MPEDAAHTISLDTSVPIFLEKFIVPVLTIIAGAVILYNPFKFDWPQRISLVVAIVATAFFCSYSLYLHSEAVRSGSGGQTGVNSSFCGQPAEAENQRQCHNTWR